MFQDTSLDFKLVQRICLLQQALDQAMDSLADLQQQVENHQMLQSHLAQTEQYSNVQQKIILNLQQQLEAKAQWQQRVLERVLGQIKHLADDQQMELERLRARIHQSQAEVQNYLRRMKDQSQAQSPLHSPDGDSDLDMTCEVMVARTLTVNLCSHLQAAQQHVYQLDRALTRYQVYIAQMKAQARAMHTPFCPDHEAEAELELEISLSDLDSLQDPVSLKAIVDAQHQKITELNVELNKQFQQHTQRNFRCQELAAERDSYRQQTADLQLENESLREQLAQLQESLQFPSTEATIPQWQTRSQDPNPLFRFKPNPN